MASPAGNVSGGPNGRWERAGTAIFSARKDDVLERRWRVTGRGRGLFAIEVDAGGGFRAATAAEVDAAVLGHRLAEGPRDASTGLMPEQKLVVPACPRRENGHLWRFDRGRSTTDCQADVCRACGLVRLTSYRTGQVVRYAGSGASTAYQR